jgi:hypothetical protein
MEELYKEILRLELFYENDEPLNDIQFKCNLTALEVLDHIKTFMLTNISNDKKIKDDLLKKVEKLERDIKFLECEAKNERDKALERMMEEDRRNTCI